MSAPVFLLAGGILLFAIWMFCKIEDHLVAILNELVTIRENLEKKP